MEEPDLDDLIEDYMEDAFEEPPPEDAYYDEDMFEEAVAAEEQNNPRPAEAAADSAQKAVGTPASPIATDFRSRLAGTSVYSPVASVESPAAQVRQDFAQSRSRSGAAKADLFSFERYKPNKSWRDDGKSASPTTMRAREWKSNKQQQKQHKSYGYSGQQRLASTPEAQLLQFQSCRSSRFNSKKIRISRHDPNMTLRPAEGKGQFPMTLGDGSRVFVKMDPIQERTSRSSRLNNDDNSNVYSLGISMTDLIRRLQAVQRKKEHDKLKALQTEARKTKRSLEKAMADDTVEEDSNAEGSENLVETELLDNGNENMQLEADKITEEESTNKSQIEDPSKFAAIDDDYNELTIIVSNIESQLGVENVLAWDEDAFYDWVRREWSARNEEHPFPDRHLERLKKQRQNKSKGQDESDRTGEKPKTSARKGEHPYRRDRHVENFKAQGKAKLKQNKDNDQSEEESTSTRPIDDRLWVDKHAPSSFANLLSDERTNREVLRALREWDPYVFNRDPPPRPKFARSNNDEEDDNDNKKDPKDKRPDEKRRVILLSGPPGVGKSTLAHIVTKHCGYRPMEVNGSDERSASVLTERVIRAMESTTLDMHASNTRKDWRGRPNCLILDEIDGADASKALKALVELIRQEARSSKEGSRRSKPYLKRPIIFICNNLYAPALRPLLPFARRFQVGAPSPARLVARLRAVLSAEGLSLWGGATLLNELVTATGGDIRSCLYTLQFAAAEVNQKKDGDISKALMSALNGNGMKDDRSDVAGTTMTVYRKCKKKGRDSALWGTKQLEDPRTSVERVLDAVESFGDNAKLLDCVYLNLMNVSYIDPTFDRCAAALEWLSGADLRSIQQVYVPCASAAVHLLCRVEKKPDLTYTTRALSDAAYQTETNRGLTHKFAEGLPPHIRNSRCSDVIAKETIPYALWMLSAGDGTSALCRPASSTEILNKAEKQAFRSHTQTLHTLGLTYVASTDEDQFVGGGRPTPTVQMVLEPPIDRIVQFRQLRTRPSDQRKEIPAQMKELLARGSVLEGIRSSETTMAVEKTSTVNKQLETKDSAPRSSKETTPLQQTDKPTETAVNKPLVTPLPEEDSSTKRSAENETEMTAVDNDRPAKKIKTAPAATQNFLGLGAKRAKAARSKKRARNVGFVPTKGTKKSNTGSGVPMNEVLRLKYVKGFTQAVRNPCKLEDLI